jgi:hypothetical protein
MNWNDPKARAALLEQVGPAEYNRLIAGHRQLTVISRVNGYDIRPVPSRFGRLFAIDGTDRAYSTLVQAEASAAKLERKL